MSKEMVAVSTAAGTAALPGTIHEVATRVGSKAPQDGVQKFRQIAEIPPNKLGTPDLKADEPEAQNGGRDRLPWPLSVFESKPVRPLVVADTDYDMILKILKLEDVLDSSKGWSLAIKSARARKALATSSTMTIGIMGAYNRGKTTVTNLLSGRSAKVGNLTHTEGVSAVLKDHMAFLDTAGQNQPLNLTRDQEDNMQAFRAWEDSATSDSGRSTLEDLFMQDMVVALSDVLVVVVNHLTMEDQRYVKVFEKKVMEIEKVSNKSKQLIVVHNLKDAESQADLDELIKKDILEGFGCQEKTFYGIGNAEYKYWSSPSTVSHCVIARHGSPAGQCVNQKTVDLITTLIQQMAATAVSTNKQKNFLQGIDSYVSTYLHNYLDHLKESDCVLNATVTEEGSGKNMSLFLDSPGLGEGVVIKREGLVSDWQVIWGAKYELDYECVVVKTADEHNNKSNHVTVVIDLPGVFQGSPTQATRKWRKEPFVHTYTWDEGAGPVVSLTIRLANQRGLGPSVEVTACRKDDKLSEHQIRTNDSGKRGTAYLTVPKSQFRETEAFADVRVHMRDNGTLLVILAEEALPDHDSSDEEAPDAAAQHKGAEHRGSSVQEKRTTGMLSQMSN